MDLYKFVGLFQISCHRLCKIEEETILVWYPVVDIVEDTLGNLGEEIVGGMRFLWKVPQNCADRPLVVSVYAQSKSLY